MNYKMIFSASGRIMQICALLMLLPATVALIYSETRSLTAFLYASVIAFVTGTLFLIIFRTKNRVIYAKEGFTITALAWVCMAVFGALPFAISGEIPSYVDALFETVSGFTTTGASILENVEVMSHSMLFWRSLTHWIGGMGVLVFIMAIVPNFADRPIHIMRAEMPGPIIGKLVPRAKDTAKILYLIYIFLTALEVIFLLFGGMTFFESVVHSFATAGTGGFGIKADSIASYSPYCQWVIAIFMLVFGVNFNLYYLILMRRIGSALKSSEIWCYLSIVAASVIGITVNILPIYKNLSLSVRHSVFQVASIVSTTGFTTENFDLWPGFSKAILFMIMITGACAGSTAGGLKISRVVILFKSVAREIKKMLHPRSVGTVNFEGKAIGEDTLNSVAIYFIVYMICILFAFLLISFEPFGFETNFTAVVTTFNNVGPGFAGVGPISNFSAYSNFSKIVFSFAMLLGRLEIFPLIIVFSPSVLFKKSNQK